MRFSEHSSPKYIRNLSPLLEKPEDNSHRKMPYYRFNDFFTYKELENQRRVPAKQTYLSGYEARFQRQFVPPLRVMKPIQDQAEEYKNALFSILKFKSLTPISSRGQVMPLVKVEKPALAQVKAKSHKQAVLPPLKVNYSEILGTISRREKKLEGALTALSQQEEKLMKKVQHTLSLIDRKAKRQRMALKLKIKRK